MNKNITIGEKYSPAVQITDQAEADAYFEQCVQHTMSHGVDRVAAEKIERGNFAYFARYYDNETRTRMEQLFCRVRPKNNSAFHEKLHQAIELAKIEITQTSMSFECLNKALDRLKESLK